MKHLGRVLTIIALAGMLAAAAPLAHAQESEVKSMATARLLSPIDERELVTLPGNVRRDLTPERDLGPVEDSVPLHLYMVLKRTPEQQADLDYLIARQQERTAAEYHKWLTPKEFGSRFGAHPDDIRTLSKWLQSHGLEVRSVLNNASIIDIAATAGQIRDTFHTEMHYFNVAGGKYAANVAEPQIPAALSPVVAGVQGMVKIPLHGNQTPILPTAFDKETNTWQRVNPSATGLLKPDFRSGTSSDFYVAPQDLYTIYNINPIFTGGNLAQTATVAVVEQNDFAYGTVNSSTGAATGGDIATFRSTFGVQGTLNMHVYHGYGTVACADPGIIAADGAQAVLSAEWANATAPSANLVFMSCDDSPDSGALTSLLAVIDNNLADVISLSYTVSESVATASDYSYMDTAEAEAATQGQSIFVAAGNSGADDEDYNTTTVATHGINVSAYSSPLVTVAGATNFQDIFDTIYSIPLSNYWNATNSQYYADAKSYVPESAWNDSCASILNSLYQTYDFSQYRDVGTNPALWCALNGTADNGTVRAGGGGISTHYAVPAWQAGISGYSSAYRASPDISSFGSDGSIYNHALLVCDSAVSVATCVGTNFGVSGGTTLVAPYLAGIAGLLVTHTGSRQGLLNPTLYALAKAQYTNSPTSCYANGQTSNVGFTKGLPAASCIFNDVTTGGNDMPCAAGSTDCYLAEAGVQFGVLAVGGTTGAIPNAYASAPGYDMATGIGSVNVANLITNWDAEFTSATALSASLTDITPSESTTLKAVVTGAGPAGDTTAPETSGTVSFKVGTTALGDCTLSGESCTLVVDGTSLAMGANSITATFSGSSLYPSSTSSVLTVTVGTVVENPTTLTSPTQGTTFAGPSETFTWALASGASGYFLHLGTTGVGSDNLLNSAEYSSTATSVTVNGLPVNGETIYARLFTDFNGTHLYKDYTFTASKQAELTAPTAGSTLAGPSATFDWSAATGSSVKGYFLHLGTTGVGSDNLLNSAEYSTSTMSVALTGLPVTGGTIYARVYTDYNGTHLYQDYTFTASTQAALTTPGTSGTLAGPDVTFGWSAATGSSVKGYFLHLGTTGVGSENLLNSAEYSTSTTSVALTDLPLTGETLYARTFTDYNGTHLYKDYVFTAAKQALLTSPAQGATLGGATVTFDWSAATGSNVKGYFLHLGTTGVGSENLLNSAEYPTTQTSVTVNNIPTTGGTVYARVFTDYNGVHVYQDYTFTAH